MRIHNYLNHLTIEEVLKYYNQGFEFIIRHGNVEAMILKKKEAKDGEQSRA